MQLQNSKDSVMAQLYYTHPMTQISEIIHNPFRDGIWVEPNAPPIIPSRTGRDNMGNRWLPISRA